MIRTPKSALDYLMNKSYTSMFLSSVTNKEVDDIISHLDSSKSIGPFNIPINLLKVLKFLISHRLAKFVSHLHLANL